MTTSIDGTLDEDFRADRALKDQPKKRRLSPIRYLRSIYAELRKVVWPTPKEVRKYAIVVLFTLLLMLAIITLLDIAFADGAVFLFK